MITTVALVGGVALRSVDGLIWTRRQVVVGGLRRGKRLMRIVALVGGVGLRRIVDMVRGAGTAGRMRNTVILVDINRLHGIAGLV